MTFQDIGHLLGSPPSNLVFGNFKGYYEDPFEENFEEVPLKEEGVISKNDIIGITNDRVRNIRDYDVYDLNAMNARFKRPKIIMV